VFDQFNRWSQIVRKPGAVEITHHHVIDVPPLGQAMPHPQARVGVRLLVRPLEPSLGVTAIDITSTQAIAMLEGFLQTGAHVGKRLSWQARGFGVRRHDTIHIQPIPGV